MAVYPEDIIVGDMDEIVVIPRHLAEEVAAQAAEQEHMEDFILRRVADGAPLRGTYPPGEEARNAFADWKRQNKGVT